MNKNNIIPTEVVEGLKSKYGMNKLRKVVQYYASGIPEKYWLDDLVDEEISQTTDAIIEYSSRKKWIAIVGDKDNVNRSVALALRKIITDQKEQAVYFDFVNLMGRVMDKFGMINLEVIRNLEAYKVVAITNIRSGDMYQHMLGWLDVILNSLSNSVMEKTIVLGIEWSGEVNEEFDIKYEKLLGILNEQFSVVNIKGQQT